MKKQKFYRAIFIALSMVLPLSFAQMAQAATITGKAMFEGQAPAAQTIRTDADPNCQLIHPDGIQDDEAIVNANNTVKNVFVYVKDGLAGKTFDTPKEPVVFDQKGCQYSPKVFGIQVNQPLEIVNSDNTLHNVHSLAEQNTQFNLGMPIQGMKLKKTFAKPEVMIKIKCDVHPWMHAYAGVLTHPFFSVTSDQGSFEIKNLPPGQYTMEAWHAKYGTQTQTVTIDSDSDSKEVSFQYKV